MGEQKDVSRSINGSHYQGAFTAKLSDSEIDKLQQGNIEAFKKCYQIYSRPVFNLSLRICLNHDIAEDITQDVFLEVFHKAEQLHNKALIGAWIRRITVNKTLNWLKKSSYVNEKSINIFSNNSGHALTHHNSYEDFSDNSTGSLDMTLETMDLAHYYLSHLSKKARLIVWLFVVEGYSHHEIAALFGKSDSFSKSVVSRSLLKIRLLKLEPSGQLKEANHNKKKSYEEKLCNIRELTS